MRDCWYCHVYHSPGAHGAGLANMVFAPQNATVIELPLRPMVNRCFGYMAMALGLNYTVIPQISSNYNGRFVVTEANAAAASRVLRQVLKTNSMSHLLKNNEEGHQAPALYDISNPSSKIRQHFASLVCDHILELFRTNWSRFISAESTKSMQLKYCQIQGFKCKPSH